jgi:hypothetical protein
MACFEMALIDAAVSITSSDIDKRIKTLEPRGREGREEKLVLGLEQEPFASFALVASLRCMVLDVDQMFWE